MIYVKIQKCIRQGGKNNKAIITNKNYQKSQKKEEKGEKLKEKEWRFLKQNLFLTSLIYSMSKIVQWNSKGLKARHKEVQLLMNRFQPSCMCLQEVMLENVKYNLGREYKFMQQSLLVKKARDEPQLQIKKKYHTKD